MRRHLLAGAAALALTMPAALAAQQKPPTPPPPTVTVTPRPVVQPPPPPPAAPTPDGRSQKVGHNVRVDVTFTEQRTDGPVQPKTVTVTTNDRQWGRVRSSVHTAGYGASPLNVDARPEVQSDGRVLLSLNLEYGEKRVPQGQDVQQGQVIETTLNESVTVALESGKPLTITQSADPMSDRKVTVEVKATVLRN
jgi:hypothetical protein